MIMSLFLGNIVNINNYKIMTHEEEKEVIRVCGKDYEESDIPSYIRNREVTEMEIEYPLGGMVEPYDIEREKELDDLRERLGIK
jgi:hypothetical protein